MAIELPNNKISRTLPEQVGFNSKKIEEIIKAINDFELVDKVIDLDSASGVLTDTQFGIAELSPSFILYSGKVFVKAYEDGTNIDFIEVGALAGGSTTLTLSVERFRITVSTKAYQYAVIQLFETYSKTQIDSMVSTINSSIASKASLSGANFTGAITAPSIIENMSGYTMSLTSIENLTMEAIYGGVVKNGNKLTIGLAINLTKTDNLGGSKQIMNLNIPSSVANKLYQTAIGSYQALDLKKVTGIYSSSSMVDLNILVEKGTNAIRFYLQSDTINSLPLNQKTFIRIEATYLLSDNLIS